MVTRAARLARTVLTATLAAVAIGIAIDPWTTATYLLRGLCIILLALALFTVTSVAFDKWEARQETRRALRHVERLQRRGGRL